MKAHANVKLQVVTCGTNRAVDYKISFLLYGSEKLYFLTGIRADYSVSKVNANEGSSRRIKLQNSAQVQSKIGLAEFGEILH